MYTHMHVILHHWHKPPTQESRKCWQQLSAQLEMLVRHCHELLTVVCSPLLWLEAGKPFWLEEVAQAAAPDVAGALLGAVRTAKALASPSSAATQEQMARVSGV